MNHEDGEIPEVDYSKSQRGIFIKALREAIIHDGAVDVLISGQWLYGVVPTNIVDDEDAYDTMVSGLHNGDPVYFDLERVDVLAVRARTVPADDL